MRLPVSTTNKITTIIVDTQNYTLGLNALKNSTHKFPTKEVLVFSDQPEKWKGYDCKTINKIASIDQYNEIILNDIVEHIKTEFALIIQYDGFVLNPQKFEPEFLDFDYIGAPWELNNYRKVGNGGFSLRSKKLFEVSKRYADTRPYNQAEDYFICREIADLLEYRGKIKYAPYSVAKKFSIEDVYLKSMRFESLPFGFHGLAILPFMYKNNLDYLLENLDPCVYKGGMRLKKLAHAFKMLGDKELNRLKKFILDKRLV